MKYFKLQIELWRMIRYEKVHSLFLWIYGYTREWLNSMSKKGYRFVYAGKLIYEFEECESDQYVYCVDCSYQEQCRPKIYTEEV